MANMFRALVNMKAHKVVN